MNPFDCSSFFGDLSDSFSFFRLIWRNLIFIYWFSRFWLICLIWFFLILFGDISFLRINRLLFNNFSVFFLWFFFDFLLFRIIRLFFNYFQSILFWFIFKIIFLWTYWLLIIFCLILWLGFVIDFFLIGNDWRLIRRFLIFASLIDFHFVSDIIYGVHALNNRNFSFVFLNFLED